MANEQKCVQFDEGLTKKDSYFWDFTVYRKPSVAGADPHRFPQFYGNRSDQFIIKKYIKIYKKCI